MVHLSPDEDSPDLSQRFQLQVSSGDPEDAETWETVASFSTIMDALHGCSSCYEGVAMVLDQAGAEDSKVEDFIHERIFDSERRAVVLWEDEEGRVRFDESAFPSPQPDQYEKWVFE